MCLCFVCSKVSSATEGAFQRPSWDTEDVKLSCIAVLGLPLMTGCGARAPGPSFDSLTEEFVYGTLALSPASATQSGYHQHKDVNLDEALDDFSAQSIASQRQFYVGFRGRLEKWKT